ncbi:MAG: glycosyltransferase family 1 protein [Actinomycetota bacterium]|jgi:glycosyltransferase involved in cell wall biosynthesis|nr:glycosyltransferase family 1 protein [Actinomycetota bacterium]
MRPDPPAGPRRAGSLGVLVVAEQLRRAAPGGIGTYALGLLGGLRRLDPGAGPEVTVLASRRRRRAVGPDPLAGPGFPVRSVPLPGPVLTRLWDAGVLGAPGGFDVVHAVSLAAPSGGGAPLVAMVHDLLWRSHPEAYPRRGSAWHEAALERLLRRASRIVVPSDVVAAELTEAGAAPEDVAVVPHGSDHLPPPDDRATEALLARNGVQGSFLLAVGTLEPRKNLDRLLDAYQRARPRLPEPWPLVVVGPAGWGDRLRHVGGVVLAGGVAPGVLAGLYRRARLLAYVPLGEGFGLPPVEAMAAGTPVVASPLPSTGGAAFEVDPHDVDGIAEALVAVATEEGLADDLRRRGGAHAARLRWSTTAERHVALWAEAAAEGPRA